MYNVVSTTVTYLKLIEQAANTLYDFIKNTSYDEGQYKNNSRVVTMCTDHTAHDKSSARDNNFTAIDFKDKYTVRSRDDIINDIKIFMESLEIPTTAIPVSASGLLSFFYALNYFMEKAIMKQTVLSTESSNTYVNIYNKPNSDKYTKLKMIYNDDNIINTDKINDIYSQLSSSDMLSNTSKGTTISSSSITSCCSSSSSSSSCSSSAFIAYFNLG